jgi:N-acetylneuraminic acid mutarotase
VKGSWQIVSDEDEEDDPRLAVSVDLRRVVGGLVVVILVVAALTPSMLDRSSSALFPVLAALGDCQGSLVGVPPSSQRGVSTPTGSMGIARSGHTATLLRSGRVLVAGGWRAFQTVAGTASSATASAEVYDPTTGTWSLTGSMKTVRAFHTAALLPSGKVLVAGGRGPATDTSELVTSAELYDPDTGRWTETGGMRAGGDFSTGVVLRSGGVFVSGGGAAPWFRKNGDPTSDAELYDPASGAWSAIGGSRVEPFGSATLLGSGKVLVVGGNQRAQLYDPITGAWKPTADMTGIREWHTATLLLSGEVLVAGGDEVYPHPISSAEIYDPVTDRWTPTSSMAAPTLGANAALLPSGEVLVAGGGTGTDRMGSRATMELYDPATARWTAPGAMEVPRSHFTATVLRSGALLLVGGEGEGARQPDQYPYYASAEIFVVRCPSR